ncbi:putative endonuclease LCL3 [Staphylotrichum tortipilum]|uniref:Probable endonuclease LCL3 n=1 Tax=Staphylotrichum tortipilum TaxID=2831512 RepID=A0AAN6MN08_9PEZI|nr:putative endonuclease LCL3 [Staphylotrichum longicolle]
MPWGRPSASSLSSRDGDDGDTRGESDRSSSSSWTPMTGHDRPPPQASPPPRRHRTPGDGGGDSWLASTADGIRGYFSHPHNWIAPTATALCTLGALTFYQSYLRRIPGTSHIAPSFFRRRSLFGKVTSVGDGDGFHLFHTPGGRLAGWGWLRRVPKDRKQLRGRTLSVRIAGVDAPEGAHFGRPAQPYAAEALAFLESYVLGRRVRAYIYKRDQYERVVATVYVRKPPFFFPRRDVGMELVKRGLAVTYEGKTGAEFGGPKMEAQYRAAEALAKKKGKGMWAAQAKGGVFGSQELESPMEYKRRMKATPAGEDQAG